MTKEYVLKPVMAIYTLLLKVSKPLIVLFFIILFHSLNAQKAFIENNGQWEETILYTSDFNGGKLYIEDGILNYNFYDTEDLDKYIYNHHNVQYYEDAQEIGFHGHCLKTNFLNSNKNLQIKEENKIEEYFNYYIGNEPSKWASKVNAYKKLIFNELYTGIDLSLEIKETGYKYDFLLEPNANADQIIIEYLGAENIRLENGNLIVKTSVNDIIEQAPYAYQIINGTKEEVPCIFKLQDEKINFEFPDGYNEKYSLVIDPFIVFSRYSGSTADNFGYTATYDHEENAYGAGSVFGIGYITTPGVFDETFNGANTDIGIVKYSTDGLVRMYSTYLGGLNTDLPHSLVVNSRNELFVMGTTSSSDFPIDTFLSEFDGSFNGGPMVNFNGLGVSYSNGSDLVIARFSEDGSDLLASTFLGGSDNDGLNNSTFLKYNYADEIRGEILTDENGNCYIVSCTNSSDFPVGPVANSFQMTPGGGLDAIVVKMDENLTNVIWSSYLGGASDDAAYSMEFDIDENLVVAGGTNSTDFPLISPYQNSFGGGNADGFITRIHSSGSGLLSSTFYGSSDYDQIYFVELNDFEDVHIFGQTKAPQDELIFNALYNNPNGGQLLAKFNKTVDTLIWATRFGEGTGIPDISPTAFLVDVCNRVFLSGWGWEVDAQINGTGGLDVSSDALDNTTDGQDFYFMVLQDDASSLIYGSYFGGSTSREHVDGGTSRFDKKGIIYQAVCAGCGGNQDFPTVPSGNNWPNNSSNCNLGVVKYAFSPPSIIADFSLPQGDCAPVSLHFENESQTAFNDTTQSVFYWVVNGDTTESYHFDYNFTTSGIYEIKLYAIDTQSCNFQDSITKQLTIIGNGFSQLDDISICQGSLNQIGISPLSGNNITYQWTPNYFLSSDIISNPFANPPVDTTYQLIVSNDNCTDTMIQSIILGSIEVEIDSFESVCLETGIELHVTEIEGALYQWSPEDLIISGQSTSTATLYAESIDQPFSVKVTNIAGCSDEVFTNVITINDLPDLEVTADPDSIEAGQNSQLMAESLQALTYEWDTNSIFTSVLDYPDPLAENIQESTTFKVTVHNGICPKTDTVRVYVILPECLDGKFYIPNAFSPNGDENNDIFRVRTTLVNIQDFYLTVFDRWGNKMFETNDKDEGWDGTYLGKELSPNVYAWYTEGICPNGEEFFLKGNVTLLK